MSFLRKKIAYKGETYVMGEVVSALQKALRRASPTAYYWADAMLAQGNWNAAFNRLKIICMEDMCAQLELPTVVHAAFLKGDAALKGKKLTDSKGIQVCRDTLYEAVAAMLPAKKSRTLANMLGVLRWEVYTSEECRKPSDVLTEFKAELTEDIRDLRLLVKLGTILLLWGNRKYTDAAWDAIEAAMPMAEKPAMRHIKSFSDVHEPLAMAQCLALLCTTGYSIGLPAFARGVPRERAATPTELLAGPAIPVPAEAIDKHTGRGRAKGMGVSEFFTDGARVEHEAFTDPYEAQNKIVYETMEKQFKKAKSVVIIKIIRERWYKAYPDQAPVKKAQVKKAPVKKEPKKRSAPEADSNEPMEKKARKVAEIEEIDNYALLHKEIEEVKEDPMTRVRDGVHAQFPCAQKPPAVIGMLDQPGDRWHGTRVFCKGPERMEHALTQLFCSRVKPLFGLRTIETRVLSYGGKHYILQPAIDTGVEKTEVREKRGVPLTIQVPSTSAAASSHFQAYLRNTADWSAIPEPVQREYLSVLLFRQVLGLTDTCNRNVFYRPPGEVYSIDETRTGRELRPEFINVTNDFKAALKRWFATHRAYWQDELRRWRDVCVLHCDLFNTDMRARIDQVEAAAKAFCA